MNPQKYLAGAVSNRRRNNNLASSRGRTRAYEQEAQDQPQVEIMRVMRTSATMPNEAQKPQTHICQETNKETQILTVDCELFLCKNI